MKCVHNLKSWNRTFAIVGETMGNLSKYVLMLRAMIISTEKGPKKS